MPLIPRYTEIEIARRHDADSAWNTRDVMADEPHRFISEKSLCSTGMETEKAFRTIP